MLMSFTAQNLYWKLCDMHGYKQKIKLSNICIYAEDLSTLNRQKGSIADMTGFPQLSQLAAFV
jgi:hypothetical protein